MANKKWFTGKKRRMFLKGKAMKYKGNICLLCGFNEVNKQEAFDFHHVYPENKSYNISKIISFNASWKKIKRELNKCVLLCAVCHRIIERKRDNDE